MNIVHCLAWAEILQANNKGNWLHKLLQPLLWASGIEEKDDDNEHSQVEVQDLDVSDVTTYSGVSETQPQGDAPVGALEKTIYVSWLLKCCFSAVYVSWIIMTNRKMLNHKMGY